MSRALIETLLKSDSTLAGLGIDEDTVFNQHDIYDPETGVGTRPPDDSLFLVIRWEESTIFNQTYTGLNNGLTRAPRMLSLWVHSPWKYGTDFEEIDQVIDRIDAIFEPIEDEPGTDGYTVTTIRNSGRSGDLKDEAQMTYTRNAAYAVLYRRT